MKKLIHRRQHLRECLIHRLVVILHHHHHHQDDGTPTSTRHGSTSCSTEYGNATSASGMEAPPAPILEMPPAPPGMEAPPAPPNMEMPPAPPEWKRLRSPNMETTGAPRMEAHAHRIWKCHQRLRNGSTSCSTRWKCTSTSRNGSTFAPPNMEMPPAPPGMEAPPAPPKWKYHQLHQNGSTSHLRNGSHQHLCTTGNGSTTGTSEWKHHRTSCSTRNGSTTNSRNGSTNGTS